MYAFIDSVSKKPMKSAKTFNLSSEVLRALKDWREKNPARFSPSDLIEMLLREYLKLEIPSLVIGDTKAVDKKVEEVKSSLNEDREQFLKRFKDNYWKKTDYERADYVHAQSLISKERVGFISEEELESYALKDALKEI